MVAITDSAIAAEMLRAGIAEAERLERCTSGKQQVNYAAVAAALRRELEQLDAPRITLDELVDQLFPPVQPLADPTDWDEKFDQLFGHASAAVDRLLDAAGERMLVVGDELERAGETVADKANDAADALDDAFGDDLRRAREATERTLDAAADQAERAFDAVLAWGAGVASGFAMAQESYRQRQAKRGQNNQPSS